MIWAVKNLFFTTIAVLVLLFATLTALSLILVFAAMWYVFFGTPVFGDFLGFMGNQGPATPPTRTTLIFVGVMFVIAAAGCYLILRSWNQWRRRIGEKRRHWLGLA